uniref:Putative conserved plasma membrane protein n=1 Tax=Corethrella appendiculata TaxID=1370023 RepID=U5EEX9_9DIPT
MFKIFYLFVIIVIINLTQVNAQSYEDKRCKCICPSIKSVDNTTQETDERMLFIDNVPPNKCDCDNVILPRLTQKLNGKEREFCPRCECKYENRNTTIIKVVVIIVIWIISLLVVYMLFLIILDPLLNKRVKANYTEHTNEEDDTSVGVSTSTMQDLHVRDNVLNRVGHQQNKWKRQVKEQRRNIYDRHTMLN